MKDKSKRLTVVNTEKKKPQTSEVVQKVVVPASSSSHAPGFNPNLYLLKSVWDSVFEIKTDVSGQKYIFGKLPVVTKYGITMYADDGSLNLPQLAEGLPYDQRTIWFNPETKQIEVIGGTGGGGEGGVSNFWDLSGIPSWITSTKPKYSYSEIEGTPDLSVYATTSSLNAVSTKLNDFATILTGKADKSYVDTNFVTIAGTEDVKGLHNFVNGLKIGGLPITKKQDDVVYLDANLVVRGGITMYAENEVNVPSILDSLPIANANTQDKASKGIASFDSAYFKVTDGWVTLTSAPSSGASYLGKLDNVDDSIDATASVDRVLYQPAGSAMWTWRELPKDGVVGNYLPLSGGTLTASVAPQLKIVNNGNTDAYITMTGSNGYSAHAGMVKLPTTGDAASFGYSERIVFPVTGGMYYRNGYNGDNQVILHAGNISSYNAGSATKLQTARTIWGQSFDGTGNVYGDLVLYAAEGGNMNSEAGKLCFHGMNGFGWGNGCYITGIANGSYGRKRMSFFQSNQLSNTPVWVEVMSILPDGNVGIGTTNPEHKLHVYGTMRSYYVSTDTVSATLNNSAGFSEYEALNYNRAWFANTQAFAVPYNSVQVALGWSNWLEGQGYHTRYSISSIRFGGWGGMSLAVGANDEGTYRGCTLELWGSGTISAGGNLTVSGGITMYSDIRKKTKLQDVELSLSQIANAPLIEHYYNSDQNKTTHVGSIAQYWAGLNDWFCKLDNEGYYTMEIQNCALASAISIARHLEKYESKTDKKIRMLKKRITELEDKLERLEGGKYGCN